MRREIHNHHTVQCHLNAKRFELHYSTKGFVEDPGGDHHFLTLWVEGKAQPVFTKLSRGSKYKTYADSLIALMCRRLFISKKEFVGADIVHAIRNRVHRNVKEGGKGLVCIYECIIGDARSIPDVDNLMLQSFPNPTHGQITVIAGLGQSRTATLTISNILGTIVAQKNVAGEISDHISADELTATLLPGTYFISLSDGARLATVPFVKY